ncbi:proton-coupled zinc antiporter SLC30A1-like [Topomyia yanbarensis]|uniref:proton-coupled zinc antiporter SLC30A1-like n=1 Tax=Topomyia yanbarensis TaxID=2498891 RepID=UPI00273B2E37|nr:proton-coupled zinc antiporter SLC30A1-like [Topomyia yanbarensis]XP_058837094.1 proton-coupled zinc antiporter SLC30A1-like [Topomyia yanbarensis]XP_058837095.1 proton-coupled zinc antiporter SLC30A1-like [Topomyia yanbarensis]XP_058837096.1 proton-coupled zinc antiporter SLC30A1-like [Topomyia yanbarensis]XP_058838278.1 proton-coupled zinc antiporter SLC30A1-like [Topomyia yanbarensis]XP_058838279.1 proton-coupled zinc antiporter SLC30A1-like [Topomyia yanbarensis]XP_058838280.1 proton-c
MAKFSGKKCRLLTVMTLTVFFFFVEIVVGYLTNSMALVADSFHMLGDIAALVISFLSIKMSPKKWSKNTFGWARAEVLGALVNAVFLVALCFSITIEACKRFIEVEHIHEPELLIWVGVIGLIVNLLGMCLLHKHGGGHMHSHGGLTHQHGLGGSHGNLTHVTNSDDNENKSFMYQNGNSIEKRTSHHGHSHDSQMNMHGAFLHVMSDALGSVIVIISALVVRFTDWEYKLYMDPALSILLVVLILNSVWPLLRDSALILLQTVPTHIQVDAIQRRLLEKVDGVLAVHEFHVWQLAGDRIIASAHIRCRNLSEYMKIAEKVKEFFHNEGIHSTTIQPEFVEIETIKSYSGSDGFSNSLNGSATQDCCALDCPTTDEASCIKATCCQNNNTIKNQPSSPTPSPYLCRQRNSRVGNDVETGSLLDQANLTSATADTDGSGLPNITV